jgi:hypothetical protein
MAKFFRGTCKSAIRYSGDKALWDFSNKIVTTEDEDIIAMLEAAGAERIVEVEAVEASDDTDDTPTFSKKSDIVEYALEKYNIVIEANSNKTMGEMLVELQGAIEDLEGK